MEEQEEIEALRNKLEDEFMKGKRELAFINPNEFNPNYVAWLENKVQALLKETVEA